MEEMSPDRAPRSRLRVSLGVRDGEHLMMRRSVSEQLVELVRYERVVGS
jgi:hypothetical protein